MKNYLLLPLAATLLSASLLVQSCNAQAPAKQPVSAFVISDYFKTDKVLDEQVNKIFNRLSDSERVGQMIVPAVGRLGKPDAEVEALIKEGRIGGVLLLNGSMESFQNYVQRFDSIAQAHNRMPLVYSADAEPSLIPRKIQGSSPVPKTAELKDVKEARAVAKTIAADLKKIGILYNYAPVTDLSKQNQAIGNRSFGSDPGHVAEMNKAFIEATQEEGIAATAKHFPGHGLVSGDTHKQLVYIDGELKESPVYLPLIDAGVLSVMVGHIAVENNEQFNTNGMPATLSRNIVTTLLKEQMGFKGIVTTDAMNMGAVSKIPDASLKAVEAGIDMVLMPLNEKETLYSILAKMDEDKAFRDQVYESVKKIIRFKLVLGVMR